MSPSVDFATRFQRLLALLRHAAARGDDGIPYPELAGEFGLTVPQLVRELETASMIGADEVHYDRMPFEVILDDDRVSVRLFSMDRPLRLTPAEALQLVASAGALANDEDEDSPLRRALAKVGAVIGVEPGEDIDVEADPDGGASGRLLRDAITAGKVVSFRYWSYGRDEVSVREVDPWAVTRADAEWYLIGLDRASSEERRFRLDRMSELQVLDATAGPGPKDLDTSRTGLPDAPEVVIDLPPDARWVVEQLPTVAAVPGVDGRITVTLRATSRTWLERLLVRVGPEAKVVDLDERLGPPEVLGAAASRMLDRYRRNGATDRAR
ncbi:MAG: WYL domain-containing protein [Acidimicrobiales bacterium]|nr:WYL domain-containing protein [Acidimicrobiales bacterium]